MGAGARECSQRSVGSEVAEQGAGLGSTVSGIWVQGPGFGARGFGPFSGGAGLRPQVARPGAEGPSQGLEVQAALQQRTGLERAPPSHQRPGAQGPGAEEEQDRGGEVSRVAFPASQQHVDQRDHSHRGQAPEDDAQQHRVAPAWGGAGGQAAGAQSVWGVSWALGKARGRGQYVGGAGLIGRDTCMGGARQVCGQDQARRGGGTWWAGPDTCVGRA